MGEMREKRLSRLRAKVMQEIRRIGQSEFAARTGVAAEAVAGFTNGDNPPADHLNAFEFYDYGPYPDLRKMISAYFYEGFSDYNPNLWKSALNRFTSAEGIGRITGASHDISSLLSTVDQDTALRTVLDEMGCYFAPERNGMTCRQWLQEVYRLLGEAKDQSTGTDIDKHSQDAARPGIYQPDQ
jgi:hypothetical protein